MLLNKQTKILIWLVLAVAFFGFIDATYLAVKFFNGTELNCGLTGGCNVVTTSEYATLFGIPVALLGSFFYATILFLSLLFIDRQYKSLPKLLLALTATGFLMSLYFVSLQLFVIDAICVYCMVSATTSTTLFILSALLVKSMRKP